MHGEIKYSSKIEPRLRAEWVVTREQVPVVVLLHLGSSSCCLIIARQKLNHVDDTQLIGVGSPVAIEETVQKQVPAGYLSFFCRRTSFDRTSIYDKHLNDRHSVTLGKH